MDSDMWSGVPSSSRRHQQQFDVLLGFDEADSGSEEDARVDYCCPYCDEEFDGLAFCYHLSNEHQPAANSGECPICEDDGVTDLISHITLMHPSYIKIDRRKKRRKSSSGSRSTLLKKNLHGGNRESSFDGSSYPVPQTSTSSDRWMSSFISNLSAVELTADEQPEYVDESEAESKPSVEEAVESPEPALPEEDKQERTRRSQFVREIMWSAMFDDVL